MSDKPSFDRQLGLLHGLPDVVTSRPTTVRVTSLVSTDTYILQTVRQRDVGDTVFLECVGDGSVTRIVIPPKVIAVLDRQRNGLTDQNRKKSAKAVAAERKRLGIQPGFLKAKKEKA